MSAGGGLNWERKNAGTGRIGQCGRHKGYWQLAIQYWKEATGSELGVMERANCDLAEPNGIAVRHQVDFGAFPGITVLIINHKDWDHNNSHSTNTLTPTQSRQSHHTICYSPIQEWQKYYKCIESSLTSIMCIHNQCSPQGNIQIAQELQCSYK